MKRIILLFFCVFVFINVSANEELLSSGQKMIRKDLVSFLEKENLNPRIDEDGDIYFNHNNGIAYLSINPFWTGENEPFLVSVMRIIPYDDDRYSKKNIENCFPLATMQNSIKLRCTDEYFQYYAEIFCKDTEAVIKSFYRILDNIDTAEEIVSSYLAAGLGNLNINLNQDEIYAKALIYYNSEDYNKSYILFSLLAYMGYPSALTYIGMSYQYGNGVAQDDNQMLTYYSKAAEYGDSNGSYMLGKYYYEKKMYSKAFERLLECSSEESDRYSDAMYLLGVMYENGNGVERDTEKAKNSYRKSVKFSRELDCNARFALKRLNVYPEDVSDFGRLDRSDLEGMTSYALYEHGREYERGLNGKYVSLSKAFGYFLTAMEKGNIAATIKMGEIMIDDHYPFNNQKESDSYYKKALKLCKHRGSDSEACYYLGWMYEYGKGVEQNRELMREYYKLSAGLGNVDACYSYAMICKEEVEYSNAFNYMSKAAEGGNGMAMYEVGTMYEKGLGVAKNISSAVEWFQKCVNADCENSDAARNALKKFENSDKF